MQLADWQAALANLRARAQGQHLQPRDACTCGQPADAAVVGTQRDSLDRPMIAWFCRCGRRRSDWLPKSVGAGRNLPEWLASECRWLDERFTEKTGSDE